MISTRIFSSKLLQKCISSCTFTFARQNKFSTQQQPHEEESADNIENLINPLQQPDFFQVHNLFTVEDLFNARVHYGHKIGTLDDNMRPFIFGSRFDHLIIDLDQTAILLRQALNFVAHMAFKDGIILFLSKNPHSTYIVDKTAKECNEFSHTRRWQPSSFANASIVYGTTTRLPDLCIFLHTMDTVTSQHAAVTDCAKMCIPTVGIVDTNCNPNLITYPVPGNDDSLSSIILYCDLFKQAILRGKQARKMLLSIGNVQEDNNAVDGKPAN